MNPSLYQIPVTAIDGTTTNLSQYQGKVILVVNVASKCGFTGQYEGLEALYKKLGPKGFVVLGFPCNQFGGQEPGSDAEIKSFCELNYKVEFPLFSKIEVNGPGTHPLFNHLKTQQKGLLGTEAIKWNFTKFLIDRTGEVVKRFAPQTTPQEIEKEIEKLLG